MKCEFYQEVIMLDLVAVISGRSLYACGCCGCSLFWDDEQAFGLWSYCPFCGKPLDDEMHI